jgi:hypothetical protein
MKRGEHKTAQARILGYAKGIDWMFVSHTLLDRAGKI